MHTSRLARLQECEILLEDAVRALGGHAIDLMIGAAHEAAQTAFDATVAALFGAAPRPNLNRSRRASSKRQPYADRSRYGAWSTPAASFCKTSFDGPLGGPLIRMCRNSGAKVA